MTEITTERARFRSRYISKCPRMKVAERCANTPRLTTNRFDLKAANMSMDHTERRFLAKVKINRRTGCHEWQGAITGTGYGNFYNGVKANGRKKFIGAHRWAWLHQVGPIEDGLHLDHLCRNRRCVNVKHLEPVTPAENARRTPPELKGRPFRRSHCANGHPFTEDNIYIQYRDRGQISRSCLVCRQLRGQGIPNEDIRSMTLVNGRAA